MEENNALTTQWYQKRQIIRCISLIPDDGIDKHLFIFSLDPMLQVEARNCIQQRRFIIQEGDRIRPLSPLLFYGVHPTQDQILSFLSGLYITLKDAICPCHHFGTEGSSSDHGKYPEYVNSALQPIEKP